MEHRFNPELRAAIYHRQHIDIPNAAAESGDDACPDCGGPLARSGRCQTCMVCGWGKCNL